MMATGTPHLSVNNHRWNTVGTHASRRIVTLKQHLISRYSSRCWTMPLSGVCVPKLSFGWLMSGWGSAKSGTVPGPAAAFVAFEPGVAVGRMCRDRVSDRGTLSVQCVVKDR
jgi:hypothetical protein